MNMRCFLSILLLIGGLAAQRQACGFSLGGSPPAWYTDQTGRSVNGDVYGPVNLGEEYRWAVPQIIYGFDESFINYFGQRGVDEIEKAIKILNDLPPMSEVDLNAYPTFSMRVNHRARDLSLLDLKSSALQILLEQMGLVSSPRFAHTLRIRDTPTGATNYLVIMRNFDPVTWDPTPYVNGQLWTYLSIYDNQDDPDTKATTVPEPVDPLILAEPVASTVPNFAPTQFGLGSYFTGLTRDDVGGLRYIYRPENRNVEVLPADATGGTGFVVGGDGSGSWTPIPAPSTNTTTDPNAPAVVGPVFYPQGIRGGVDRVQWLRGGSGVFNQPLAYQVTNRFTEQVSVIITNGVQRTISQNVIRIVLQPDILFIASDLAGPTTPGAMARSDNSTSNDAINGLSTLDGPGNLAGPGTIEFTKVGLAYFNSQPNFLSQPADSTFFVWGAFDGSTNDPAVFPNGASIRDVEASVFGGR